MLCTLQQHYFFLHKPWQRVNVKKSPSNGLVLKKQRQFMKKMKKLDLKLNVWLCTLFIYYRLLSPPVHSFPGCGRRRSASDCFVQFLASFISFKTQIIPNRRLNILFAQLILVDFSFLRTCTQTHKHTEHACALI